MDDFVVYVIKPTFGRKKFLIDNKTFLSYYRYSLTDYKSRKEYIKYSFPILTYNWLKPLADFLKKYNYRTVDLCCGVGYISFYLKKLGLKNIKAVDNFTWNDHWKRKPLKHVKKYNALKYVKYHKNYDAVILSWPLYESRLAYNIARNLKLNTILIYIGEGYGGCTGDNNFHEYLHKNFKLLEDITNNLQDNFLNFDGMHDNIYIYEKISQKEIPKNKESKNF